jgi:long-subunit acyl-CoA synthetase (AMP-forming)
VMAGYLGNEQPNRETIDDEDWLHTGDLAQVDACGCVWIVDRLKELISTRTTKCRSLNSKRCC